MRSGNNFGDDYRWAPIIGGPQLSVGRDSSVGIAIGYELDGPGIESADPSGRAV